MRAGAIALTHIMNARCYRQSQATGLRRQLLYGHANTIFAMMSAIDAMMSPAARPSSFRFARTNNKSTLTRNAEGGDFMIHYILFSRARAYQREHVASS